MNHGATRGGPRLLKGLQKIHRSSQGNLVFSLNDRGADWLWCVVWSVHAVHENSKCVIVRWWLLAVKIGWWRKFLYIRLHADRHPMAALDPEDDPTIQNTFDGDQDFRCMICGQISSINMRSDGQNLIRPNLGRYASNFDDF